MNTYDVNPTDQPSQTDTAIHHDPGSPGVSAGDAGASGTTAETVEQLSGQQHHPTLPSMEEYFPPSPLEFNNSPISLTDEAQNLFKKWEAEDTSSRGACINIFPSGEITGGYYRTGRRSFPRKKERLISQEFTRQARKTVRRAVESGLTTFRLFITLTFDPKQSQLDEAGHVDQQWAKEKFKRFLNTVKKKYDRKAEKAETTKNELSYIWTAEIQELNTKNIHFHILVDQPFIPVQWLVTIWGQAANSVNVKRITNQEHAAKYMLKYMSKGHCPIEGKRYGMTQNLLAQIKPRKIRFAGEDRREAFRKVKREFYWDIENNGGKVTDFGLSIPAPRRSRVWRDKKGMIRTTKGVPKELSERFIHALDKPMKRIDFEEEVDAAHPDNSADDLPF